MNEQYGIPKPKFAKDVHLDATGMWAKDVRFNDTMAAKISEACNSVDGEWWDEGLKWILKGSGNAGYYHYMTDKPENRFRDWHLAEKISNRSHLFLIFPSSVDYFRSKLALCVILSPWGRCYHLTLSCNY